MGVTQATAPPSPTLDIARLWCFELTGQTLLWADLMVPNHSRESERAADRLGLDLMLRAGFNHEESLAVVDKIHDAAASRSARIEQLGG